MMIWAAVDLLDGQCVQLRGGDPKTARYAQDPLSTASRWANEGADGLHLIDLNAALGQGHNRQLLEEILVTIDLPIQIGGGVREAQEIERWLDAGAQRVIVGTRGVQDIKWLKETVTRFPRQIVLALDARGGEVTVEGWTHGSGRRILDVARAVDDLNLAALLYTNVGIEGSLQGIDPKPVAELCAAVRTPALVSGGLRDADDVRTAYRLGATGVVLGTAIYAGTIKLADLRCKRGKT
jgi:phosphoribosylformimino-5-aminoimidazole carboxamide ribotide isomerase